MPVSKSAANSSDSASATDEVTSLEELERQAAKVQEQIAMAKERKRIAEEEERKRIAEEEERKRVAEEEERKRVEEEAERKGIAEEEECKKITEEDEGEDEVDEEEDEYAGPTKTRSRISKTIPSDGEDVEQPGTHMGLFFWYLADRIKVSKISRRQSKKKTLPFLAPKTKTRSPPRKAIQAVFRVCPNLETVNGRRPSLYSDSEALQSQARAFPVTKTRSSASCRGQNF